ncbi:hypothetical protein RhiLY_03548 [Ceratobasidium sp. AG-Ba]|nr:hypothetical protein RhiLY_03548 [Ceratobasidium sp. AG-Ba]
MGMNRSSATKRPPGACVSPSPPSTATTLSTASYDIRQHPTDIHFTPLVGMAGIMLRSLSNPRTPLPFIGDPLSVSAAMGCPAWSHPGPEERTNPGLGGAGKTKHTPESHRASPYPPLARSSSGYGSAAGLKRLAAVTRSQSQTSQSLRRTASLQGGDSLAALQESCRNTQVPRQPPPPPRRHSRPGSNGRALRPAPTLVNLDLLVCPPPAPPPRSDIRIHFPTPPQPPPPVRQPPPSQPLRRRSSLAPAETAPAAMSPTRDDGQEKRESLAQRTLRRTFERTPRGAQVKVLGAHAAVRMMTAMNENEEADEAAVAASVVVVDEDECMADADAWVELNESPISPITDSSSSLLPLSVGHALPVRESPSPIWVEAPLASHIPQSDDMEWSMIDENECRAG